jgi:hypothetical protein
LTPAPGPLRWAGRLTEYGDAALYCGLDAVAGVSARSAEDASGGASPLGGRLFEVGDMIGYIEAWCFLVASVCVVAGSCRVLVGVRAGDGVGPARLGVVAGLSG